MPQPDHSRQKAQAIALLFEGRWSQREIADKIGINVRSLSRWLQDETFRGQLAAMRADFAASVRDVAYADKARRIMALDAMAELARREFEARPLLIERRPTGRDPDTGELLILEQEAFNRDAHAAFRDSLNDIAKELGERGANVRVTGQIEHSLVPQGQAAALVDELLAAVDYAPDARAALAQRLLSAGDGEGE